MRNVQQKLSVARGERPAGLLFKNARDVNVFSGEIHAANVEDRLRAELLRA